MVAGHTRGASPSGSGRLPSPAAHQAQGDKAASELVDLGGVPDSLDHLPNRLATWAGDDDGELHRVFGAFLADDAQSGGPQGQRPALGGRRTGTGPGPGRCCPLPRARTSVSARVALHLAYRLVRQPSPA